MSFLDWAGTLVDVALGIPRAVLDIGQGIDIARERAAARTPYVGPGAVGAKGEWLVPGLIDPIIESQKRLLGYWDEVPVEPSQSAGPHWRSELIRRAMEMIQPSGVRDFGVPSSEKEWNIFTPLEGLREIFEGRRGEKTEAPKTRRVWREGSWQPEKLIPDYERLAKEFLSGEISYKPDFYTRPRTTIEVADLLREAPSMLEPSLEGGTRVSLETPRIGGDVRLGPIGRIETPELSPEATAKYYEKAVGPALRRELEETVLPNIREAAATKGAFFGSQKGRLIQDALARYEETYGSGLAAQQLENMRLLAKMKQEADIERARLGLERELEREKLESTREISQADLEKALRIAEGELGTRRALGLMEAENQRNIEYSQMLADLLKARESLSTKGQIARMLSDEDRIRLFNEAMMRLSESAKARQVEGLKLREAAAEIPLRRYGIEQDIWGTHQARKDARAEALYKEWLRQQGSAQDWARLGIGYLGAPPLGGIYGPSGPWGYQNQGGGGSTAASRGSGSGWLKGAGMGTSTAGAILASGSNPVTPWITVPMMIGGSMAMGG